MFCVVEQCLLGGCAVFDRDDRAKMVVDACEQAGLDAAAEVQIAVIGIRTRPEESGDQAFCHVRNPHGPGLGVGGV